MPTAGDAAPSRLKNAPTWLISQTALHSHRLLNDAFAAAGVRGYQYRLLAALQEFGPASQATLGRRTEIDRSDVVAAVNDLAARGMVERSPDHADRRRNIIRITRVGIVQLERLDRIVAHVQDELLAPLSRTERRALIRLLTQVLEHHTTRGSGAR